MMNVFLLALIAFVGSTRQTYAYLDPGSGSYFFQILVGGLLGSILIIKTYGSAMIESFKQKFTSTKEDGDDKQEKTNTN